MIGEFEEKILMAVLKNQPKAYGVVIYETLEEFGRRVNIGAIYTTLGRLDDKGMVTFTEEEGGPKRGGRKKKFFEVTSKGLEAINEAREQRARIEASANWGTWGLAYVK